MKLVLIVLLLFSFGNSPHILLATDDSHSVALVNKHGVDHLVFFHRASDPDTVSYFTPTENDEHHEVHLSNSTGLIQKRHQISTLANGILNIVDPLNSSITVAGPLPSIIEMDVGKIHPPPLVLRT